MSKGWGDLFLEMEHAITEIDLELHQWQEDLDMMSFIGFNASFELWTNDDPPVVITREVMTEALVAAAGKELRVMNYLDGKPTQVGTAVIAPDGTIAARIDKDIPGLTDVGRMAFSVGKDEMWRPLPSERLVLPGFPPESVPADVPKIVPLWETELLRNRRLNPPFEGLNKPLTDLENHPFFRDDEIIKKKRD